MFRFGAPRASVGMRLVCAENTSVISCHPVIRLPLDYRSSAAFLPASNPVPLLRVQLAWLNPDAGPASAPSKSSPMCAHRFVIAIGCPNGATSLTDDSGVITSNQEAV